MKWISKLLIASLLVLSVSCGDLFTDDKIEGPSVELLSCEFDSKAFSFILDEDISTDIKCLKETLNVFMNLVETDRIGYVSKSRLIEFIKSSMDDVDENLVNVIDSMFDISHLLLGEDREYISRDGINKLTDFLIFFNSNIWPITKFFKSDDSVNYARHSKERQKVESKLALISNRLSELYVENRDEKSDTINLRKLAETFFKQRDEVWKKVESLLFLKRIILGGSIEEISHLELKNAFGKLPSLSVIAFDLSRVKHFDFSDDQMTMMGLYREDISLAHRMFYYEPDESEVVMTIWDAFEVIKQFVPEFDIEISKYSDEVKVVKEILLITDEEEFSSAEVSILFSRVYDVLDRAHFFFRVYSHFADDLNSPKPLSVDLGEFPVNSSIEQLYLDDFIRIVSNYRYVKGSFHVPFFSRDHQRNPNAYFEISAIEYLVRLVMKKHGSKIESDDHDYKNRGDYHLTVDQTISVIDKLKNFLWDQDVINVGRVDGGEKIIVAENLVLMSTLFQNQSNGCRDEACMEIPEITEFGLGLITALSIKSFVVDEMQNVLCTGEDDITFDGRIKVDCFRRNFMKVLTTPMDKTSGVALRDYMPVLYDYLEELVRESEQGGDDKYTGFVKEVENFTRVCTHYDPENQSDDNIVPMNDTDVFGVFAGLLNIEPVMMRFDVNEDGVMNGTDLKNSEIMTAYDEVFKLQIEGLVGNMVGDWAKFASPIIFQYLIKTGEVPGKDFGSIFKFIKFLTKFKQRGADASRATIAEVLTTIGTTSETKKAHPYKCEECLRDVNTVCQPEGDW